MRNVPRNRRTEIIPSAAGPRFAHSRQHRARMGPARSKAERANLGILPRDAIRILYLPSLIEVAYPDVAKEGDQRPSRKRPIERYEHTDKKRMSPKIVKVN